MSNLSWRSHSSTPEYNKKALYFPQTSSNLLLSATLLRFSKGLNFMSFACNKLRECTYYVHCILLYFKNLHVSTVCYSEAGKGRCHNHKQYFSALYKQLANWSIKIVMELFGLRCNLLLN